MFSKYVEIERGSKTGIPIQDPITGRIATDLATNTSAGDVQFLGSACGDPGCDGLVGLSLTRISAERETRA